MQYRPTYETEGDKQRAARVLRHVGKAWGPVAKTKDKASNDFIYRGKDSEIKCRRGRPGHFEAFVHVDKFSRFVVWASFDRVPGEPKGWGKLNAIRYVDTMKTPPIDTRMFARRGERPKLCDFYSDADLIDFRTRPAL